MKIYRYILLLTLFNNSFAQIIEESNFEELTAIPKEEVYIQTPTSFLLAGEYLYYKLYCINSETTKLSNISKVGYVALISKDREPIFNHKIKLIKGVGFGGFFINTTVPSGNYKIIAYTQWMKNSAKNIFYQNDITIVNPFLANQKTLLDTNLKQQNTIKEVSFSESEINTDGSIKIKKKKYQPREKISISILNPSKTFLNGHYAISVRKIDKIKKTAGNSIKTYASLFNTPTKHYKTINYLPEIRGEIFSGKVLSKLTNKPISNIKLAFSIQGDHNIFKIATTNLEGIYYFNILDEYLVNNANIQIVSDDRENYTIVPSLKIKNDYSNLKFNHFKLSPTMKSLILERSINNQIENAYFEIKPDSIKKATELSSPFKNEIEYNLDDFTRFKTMKETIVEIINDVIIKTKKKKKYFYIKPFPYVPTNIDPMVIIDGVLIQNHNELIDSDAKKIKKISFIRDKYIYGGKTYQGILIFDTYNNNYKTLDKGLSTLQLNKYKASKKYFNQTYENDKFDRVPDFRTQLLWNPNLKLNTKNTLIEFYASDNKGVFEIIIEGFTANGNTVRIKEVFEIQ